MRELDRRIATLRLRLAEIGARQEQVRALQRQFRSQLDKVMEFAVYERGELDSALSMADEVEARLAQTERTLRHLDGIRARGQEELDALLLTRSIQTARSELAELEGRRRELEAEMERLRVGSAPSEAENGNREKLAQLEARHARLGAEIRQLRRVISQASDEAARAVSAKKRMASGE